MHPAFLDAMSWEMAEVYGAITDQILINLARHFPFYVAGEDLPTSAFAYQSKMLAQMGQVNAETMRIIRNGLADADPALVNCLEQSIIDAVNGADKDLAKAVKKGIFAPPAAPVLSPNQYKAFDLYYKQAADKLNLVNTVMLESTQSAYRQAVSDVISEIDVADRINRTQIAIDAAAGETVTGVSSWNQALRHAADKLNNGGIVGFIDHAGRRWSAEAYVAMDIRTTVFNAGRAAVWETNQNFGNDLYSVSYHNGARPLCYPWQNKVISSLDAARTVIDLDGNEIEVIAQSATSYGAPAGLFGINCKHYPTPFIPGVSVLTGQPQSKEENERVYEESQTQREMERTLREQKRDYLTAKAQGRPQEELDYLRGKCRETSGQIDEFCEKTGRARHRDREGVYTKREFPDAKKYDVNEFKNKQQEMINGFFDKGGAQQNYTFGQMTPNVPLTPKTAEPPATVKNVASKATQGKAQAGTINAAKLDAKNFPDSFNPKKTKTFVDTVNATEGTDTNVVKLFNKMGEQVKGVNYPVEISYTEKGHAVGQYTWGYGGKRAKLFTKVPKLIDADYLRQEVGTTAHEWGHLFDHLHSEKGVLSDTFNNRELPNALKNARPMSERVRTLIDSAVKDGISAERSALAATSKEIDAIQEEVIKALTENDYAKANKLVKQRDKVWKNSALNASKASRKAHNGVNAIEDIYDAISGGTLRDKTPGLYGHGSRYYGHNPGGENAAAETIANYCSLALVYPELFQLMAEEQPEIWEACGNIIKAMIGD